MAEEVLPVETPKPFDFAAYKAERNTGATATPAQPAKVEEKSAATPATDEEQEEAAGDAHTPKLPRSVRRELNDLRRKLGMAEGQLQLVRELQAAGMTKAEAKAEAAAVTPAGEPTRDQFATDAEYYKAVARFEVRAEIAKGDQAKALETEQGAYMATVNKATEKFGEDVKMFPDWADVVEEMDEIAIDTKEQATFIGLIAQSEQRAAVLYHLSKNPAERDSLFKMSPAAQIAAFHRLEGRMETKYSKAPEEKPKPTAAELDAKKAKPSQSVAVKGGKAAEVGPSMLLADGRTMNPAWKAAQNEAAGIRR